MLFRPSPCRLPRYSGSDDVRQHVPAPSLQVYRTEKLLREHFAREIRRELDRIGLRERRTLPLVTSYAERTSVSPSQLPCFPMRTYMFHKIGRRKVPYRPFRDLGS